MFKKVLITLVVLLGIFAAFVASRPDDFTVTRSASINASPAKVHAIVNNMRRWNDWSPWAKRDPQMKTTFKGPESGVGAAQSWEGNKEVGSGKMTITKSVPAQLVDFQLEFFKPFKGVNQVEFSFKPEGKGTLVSWTMSGKYNFISKAICLFVSMDKMIGGDFENGLAGLKSLAEAPAAKK